MVIFPATGYVVAGTRRSELKRGEGTHMGNDRNEPGCKKGAASTWRRGRERCAGTSWCWGRRSSGDPAGPALSSSGPAGASPSNVDPNGVLKYGFDLNNEFSNDFAPATEQNDCSYTVTANIYQSMTTPGNSAIGGGVAQSWTISNNGSTVTFHIRPGLEFSNGQPVTSADVAASLNNTKTSPLRSSLFAISNIQTPDPSTVVVNLSKPTAGDFLWAMTYIDGQIYPANAISSQSSQPVGAGPYLLKSYRPGLVDRAREEPQVLELEGVSARWHGLHPGDPGTRSGDVRSTSGAVDMISGRAGELLRS